MNPEEDDWEGEGGLTIDPEDDIIRTQQQLRRSNEQARIPTRKRQQRFML